MADAHIIAQDLLGTCKSLDETLEENGLTYSGATIEFLKEIDDDGVCVECQDD